MRRDSRNQLDCRRKFWLHFLPSLGPHSIMHAARNVSRLSHVKCMFLLFRKPFDPTEDMLAVVAQSEHAIIQRYRTCVLIYKFKS